MNEWVLDHDLIQKEFTRLKKLKCWRKDVSRAYLDKIRHRKNYYTTGRCWYHDGRIVITLALNSDKTQVCALLLHELAHAAAPKGHTQKWRRAFRDAAHEAYGGLAVVADAKNLHVVHSRIEAAIREHIAPGTADIVEWAKPRLPVPVRLKCHNCQRAVVTITPVMAEEEQWCPWCRKESSDEITPPQTSL